MKDKLVETPLEPARRILGPGGQDGEITTGREGRTIVLRDMAADTLRIHVRMAALGAAVAGGGISETPHKTTATAEAYETWIMREITE